jgi:hypothetical protein
LLQGLQREFELTVEIIDIEDDVELYDRYWDKIPVLLIDERTTLATPIRTADVRAALKNS